MAHEHPKNPEQDDTPVIDIIKPATFNLINPQTGAASPLAVNLEFSKEMPLAVSFVFSPEAESKTWTLGRELVSEGMYEPKGEGDIQIWPSVGAEGKATVMIALAVGKSAFLVQALAKDVHEFINETTRIAPVDEEFWAPHMDAELEEIFRAE
jgi:hypothetical protein